MVVLWLRGVFGIDLGWLLVLGVTCEFVFCGWCRGLLSLWCDCCDGLICLWFVERFGFEVALLLGLEGWL